MNKFLLSTNAHLMCKAILIIKRLTRTLFASEADLKHSKINHGYPKQ